MGRWLQKPLPGFYDLDRTHPSAHKLLIYLPFTEGVKAAPANIATPSMIGSQTGCVFRFSARYRSGIRSNQFGSIQVTNPANVNAAAGDFMVRLLIRVNVLTSNFTVFIDKGSGGKELELQADLSGNLVYYGVGGGEGFISIPTGMTIGRDYDFVWARSGSTNTAYVDGVAKGTWTQGATVQQGSNIPWVFGQNVNGGGGSSDADITYCGIQFWTRAPYPGEVLALYNDPFGMLKPRIARRYTGAGTSTPVAPSVLTWLPQQQVAGGWPDTMIPSGMS